MATSFSRELLNEIWAENSEVSPREILSSIGRSIAGLVFISDSKVLRNAAAELASSIAVEQAEKKFVNLGDVFFALCEILDAVATTVEHRSASAAKSLADRLLIKLLRLGAQSPAKLNSELFRERARHSTRLKLDRVLKKLETEGLVSVAEDANDKRKTPYSLTEHGIFTARRLAGEDNIPSKIALKDEENAPSDEELGEEVLVRVGADGAPPQNFPSAHVSSSEPARLNGTDGLTAELQSKRRLLECRPEQREPDPRWQRFEAELKAALDAELFATEGATNEKLSLPTKPSDEHKLAAEEARKFRKNVFRQASPPMLAEFIKPERELACAD